MRVAVLSSGGKDSAAAWWWAICKGWTIDSLVTVRVHGDDSHMFQLPGTEQVEVQAKLANIPWVAVPSSGQSNQEMKDLEHALRERDIDGFVSGALRSDYQKSRLEQMAERLNVKCWTPLWHHDGLDHVHGMVEHGFQIMITAVSCEGLDDAWLGKILTLEDVDQLDKLAKKHRFNVEGEGGEYETLVTSGPHFHGSMELTTTKHWDGVRGHLTFH